MAPKDGDDAEGGGGQRAPGLWSHDVPFVLCFLWSCRRRSPKGAGAKWMVQQFSNAKRMLLASWWLHTNDTFRYMCMSQNSNKRITSQVWVNVDDTFTNMLEGSLLYSQSLVKMGFIVSSKGAWSSTHTACGFEESGSLWAFWSNSSV